MVNRVLIRIKVIQLLYAYLLTEKLFTLESQPTPPTKEKRFAYRLYIDMLVLMTRIADSVQQRGGHKPLVDNRFIRTVLSDEKIKSQIARNRLEPSPLDSTALIDRLSAAVKDSSVYKAYVKNGASDMASDLKVWREIFSLFIAPDAELARLYTEMPNYSLRGVERMQELMETTFSNFSSSQGHVADMAKTLTYSLETAHKLYYILLLLAVDLTRLQEQNLDAARHKYLTTEEDMNPDLRFVENKFIALLTQNRTFLDFVEKHKMSWIANERVILASLLKKVFDSDIYRDYMAAPKPTLEDDCRLWKNLLRYVILPDGDLQETLEDKSVFWNDDLDTIGTFVLKTIRRFEEGVSEPILPMFKDDEDARFGRELFNAVVKGKEEYAEILDKALNKDSWETDRLAFMDVVIAYTALAEILKFPKIPVNVSINEYIEIAKAYSTPKSSLFINGLLGAAIVNLRESGRLVKP